MLDVLLKILPFLFMIAVGYAMKRIGVFKKSDVGILSRLIFNITLPCTVITTFSKISPPLVLMTLVLLGVSINLLLAGIGYLGAKKETPMGKAFAMINTAGFNIGTFSLPFVQIFFGPAGIVATCLFDAGNAIMCTGGTYAMAASVADHTRRTPLSEFLKKIFSSVTLDTYLIMLLLSSTGVKLPALFLSFTGIVAGATAFLAMTMIGISLEFKFPKSHHLVIFRTLVLRFVTAGLLAMLIYWILPFADEVKRVMMLLVFAPISSASPAFTDRLGGDVGLSGAINSGSILISIVLTILVLMI